VDHLNQINTIHLNPAPIKNKKGDRYVRPPLGAGKTVLVVDDFCTEGNSLEAARAYIQAAGSKAIGLAWLKTINRDYKEIRPLPKLLPYQPNQLSAPPKVVFHGYHTHIRDGQAAADLKEVFEKYAKWDWP